MRHQEVTLPFLLGELKPGPKSPWLLSCSWPTVTVPVTLELSRKPVMAWEMPCSIIQVSTESSDVFPLHLQCLDGQALKISHVEVVHRK